MPKEDITEGMNDMCIEGGEDKTSKLVEKVIRLHVDIIGDAFWNKSITLLK